MKNLTGKNKKYCKHLLDLLHNDEKKDEKQRSIIERNLLDYTQKSEIMLTR